MCNPASEAELLKLLDRLKERKILNIFDLSGDEIMLAEKLVELKLASKISTRISSVYYYGTGDTK